MYPLVQKYAACIVKCSVDGKWYRGKIMSIVGSTECDVMFVDVGKTERVSICKLRAMLQKFTTISPQAYPCTLNGRCPENWTPENKSLFKKNSKGKKLFAKFQKMGNDPSRYPTVLSEKRPYGTIIVLNNLLVFSRSSLTHMNLRKPSKTVILHVFPISFVIIKRKKLCNR